MPIAAVLEPSEALRADHFQAVGAMTDAELVPGVRTERAGRYFVVDGQRAGFRAPAPAAGADEPRWHGPGDPHRPGSATASGSVPTPCRSTGLRIVDLGIIVAGGELSRLFADLGAEVIKVESAAYPDGLRQTQPGTPMSRSWA